MSRLLSISGLCLPLVLALSTATNAQTLPAGVYISGSTEGNYQVFSTASGSNWRDYTNTGFTNLTIGYDGTAAGTMPAGFEFSLDGYTALSYKNGGIVRENNVVGLYASAFIDTSLGRFTLGRARPMIEDYVQFPDVSQSKSYIALRNTNRMSWANAVRQGTGSSGIQPVFWTARYDTPWFSVGETGRLRFGVEMLSLNKAARLTSYYPDGTQFYTVAARYEADDLAIGLGYYRSNLSSVAGSLPVDGYTLSADYTPGPWEFGAGLALHLYDNLDLAYMQVAYNFNDNLRVSLSGENYIHNDGQPSPVYVGADARYRFDNGFYAGATIRSNVDGIDNHYTDRALYLGWEFDLGR